MTRTSAGAPPDWPNVPACHGWLSLDARGHWRLKGERVEHRGLLAFLNANYASDGAGNWLVHNGPQRVFVELEAAPWILRMLPDEILQTHSGCLATPAAPVLVDESGHVSLQTDLGPAAIDDRDLALFLAELKTEQGDPVSDATLLALFEGHFTAPVQWRSLPLTFTPSSQTPGRLGYQRKPVATA